jgi:hypothetical protein
MSQYHFDHILAEICSFHGTGDRRRLVVHTDNTKPHTTQRVKSFQDGYNLRTEPHPPDSPVLAPNDFSLFGHVRSAQVSKVSNCERVSRNDGSNSE